MNVKHIFFTLFFLTPALLISCKKEKSVEAQASPTDPDPEVPSGCDTSYTDIHLNDTIFPSAYLMTYPGSEWFYDDGSSSSCDSWQLVGIAVKTNQSGCPEVNRTFHVLPNFGGGYVMNNSFVSTSNPVASIVRQYLDTVAGQFTTYYETYGQMAPFYGGSRNHTLEVVELLPAMDVLGTTFYDVIHVHELILENDNDMGTSQGTTDKFYARNVGLIQSVSVIHGWTNTRKLTSYNIGPH